MECKAKLAAAQADRLLEEEMKSQSKKKKNKSNKVLYKKKNAVIFTLIFSLELVFIIVDVSSSRKS